MDGSFLFELFRKFEISENCPPPFFQFPHKMDLEKSPQNNDFEKIEELSLQEISDIKSTDLSENHLTSRDQILGNVNFELKVNKEQETLNTIFVEKIIEITNPEDIVSSFDWGTILSNREKFNSRYGILIDEENQLFESKAISNLDDNLMFMIQKDIFHSRKFDLPKDKCVVWTVNDKDEIDNILNTGVYGVVTDIGDKL